VVLNSANEKQLEVYSGSLQNGESDPTPELIAVPDNEPLYDELKRFVGYINGGVPPYSTGQDAYEAVLCIETLRKLARINSP